MSNGPLIPHDLAARTIEDALRLRVGRGKRHSFPGLSDATGIPTRTLESYVQGATPGLAGLLTLFSVLGPSFASDILALCGQTASSGSTDDPEYMRTLGALCSTAAVISEAMADGKVDHRERLEIQPIAAELMQILEPLARPLRCPTTLT